MFNFVYKDIDFAHKLDEAGNPTENFEKHIHHFNEIVIFVSGDVVYTIETESRKLQPGDIIFIPSGKCHFATVNIKSNYERYVFKFPDKYLPECIKQRRDNSSCFLGKINRYYGSLKQFDYLKIDYTDEELYTIYLCDMIELLIKLFNKPIEIKKSAPKIISELINYINNHINEKITLDSLSLEFNFSQSYISNSFKLYMKIPIIQYIRTKKILAAHKMIANGTKVAQVASYFGFSNYSTFYRSYVKIFGFAPTEHNLV